MLHSLTLSTSIEDSLGLESENWLKPLAYRVLTIERAADKRLFLWYNHNLKSVRTVIPAKAGTPNLTVNLIFTYHLSFNENAVREPPTSPLISFLLIT
jgi:hypothetical protein